MSTTRAPLIWTCPAASGDITVAWDHGAEGTSLSGLAGGQYYAVVTDDNGCTKDVRVMVEDSPTVEANFTAPSAGLTDGVNGMTMSFTNTSEGNITGQTWYFGDTETPSYDFHATHTFEVAGVYDVFLNVWNDKCSHTVRKTVVASQGEGSNNDDLGALVTNVAEGNLTEIHAPVTTPAGWMMDLGARRRRHEGPRVRLDWTSAVHACGCRWQRPNLDRRRPMARPGVVAFGARTHQQHSDLENGALNACTGR